MFLLETISLFTNRQHTQCCETLPLLKNSSGYEVIDCLSQTAFSSLCQFLSSSFLYKAIEVSLKNDQAEVIIVGKTSQMSHLMQAKFKQALSVSRGRQLQIAIEPTVKTLFLENQIASVSQACNVRLVNATNKADIVFTSSSASNQGQSGWQVEVFDIDNLPEALPPHWLALPCFDSDIISLINQFRCSSRPRVLLADDSPSSLVTTQLLLETLNCDVTTATDGIQAHAMLQGSEYDLVLLDERMPGLKGSEVVQSMCKSGNLAQSLTVALSGMTEKSEIEYLKSSGFEKHLCKPVKRQQLMQLINEWKGAISVN